MNTSRPPQSREADRRIEEIFSAAEMSAHEYAARLENEATARATKLVADAESEAQQRREKAQVEVLAYLDESRRRIDSYAADRVRKISDLTDSLVEMADEIEERFAGAAEVRRQMNELVLALGGAAEGAAAQLGRPGPRLPGLPGVPVPQIGRSATGTDDLPGDLAAYARDPHDDEEPEREHDDEDEE